MLTAIGYLIGVIIAATLTVSLITTLLIGYLIIKSHKEWWK